jgi:hypothetical protein
VPANLKPSFSRKRESRDAPTTLAKEAISVSYRVRHVEFEELY